MKKQLPFHLFILPLVLFISLNLTQYLPPWSLDSGGIFSVKLLLTIFCALGLIQSLGILFYRFLDAQHGSILHGFLAGIVSSTAFTVSIAKDSKIEDSNETSIKSLGILSSNIAMLIQAVFFVFFVIGVRDAKSTLLFTGPFVAMTSLLIFRQLKTRTRKMKVLPTTKMDWLSVLGLSILIALMVGGARILSKVIGPEGFGLLTFTLSLFEIHGSMIVLSELYSLKDLTQERFLFLISLSLTASFLAKWTLILFAGSNYLRWRAGLWFSVLTLSVWVSWALARFVF